MNFFARHQRFRPYLLLAGPFFVGASGYLGNTWLSGSSSRPALSTNRVFVDPSLLDRPHSALGTKSYDLSLRCQQMARLWRTRLGDGCAAVAFPPFVLAGDVPEEELRRRYEATIRPAKNAMSRLYFRTPPCEPVTLLLFSNETRYHHYTYKVFGDGARSVYGHYRSRWRTVLANSSTGNGTVIHELTHALMHADFPSAPLWLHEGLASLHEEASIQEVEGGVKIVGYPNWRLRTLREHLLRENPPSLAQLFQEQDPRMERESLHYAQARFLCLYLQEHELLVPYYHALREVQPHDPFGEATLQRTLGITRWETFDEEFRDWALRLDPPPAPQPLASLE